MEPAALGEDTFVTACTLQAKAEHPSARPIEHEILGDAEPRVTRHVRVEVLLFVAAHVDLDHQIEPLPVATHDPALTLMRLDVDDGQDIRTESRLARVVRDQLARHVHAPPDRAKELVERISRSLLRLSMVIPL